MDNEPPPPTAAEEFQTASRQVRDALENAVKTLALPSVPDHSVTLQDLPQFLRERPRAFDVIRTIGDSGKELEELARDRNTGARKKLTDEMMKSLWETGTFGVPSLARPEQNHTWMVNRLLIKGKKNIEETMLEDLALSVHVPVVECKDLVNKTTPFSLNSFWTDSIHWVRNLANQLVGVPTMVPKYSIKEIDAKVSEERVRFVIAHLSETADEDLLAFKDAFILLQAMNLASNSGSAADRVSSEEQSQVTAHKEMMERCQTAFSVQRSIQLQVAGRLDRTANVLTATVTKEMPPLTRPFAIQAEVARRRQTMYRDQVAESLEQEDRLQQLAPNLGLLMSAFFLYEDILSEERAVSEAKRQALVMDIRKRLREDHPFMSRITRWLDEQVDKELRCTWNTESEEMEIRSRCAERLARLKLDSQNRHFKFVAEVLGLQNRFDREAAVDIADGLKKELRPAHRFTERRIIWNPYNWTAEEYYGCKNGVLVKQFRAKQYVEYNMDSSKWFWRIRCLPVRWYVQVSNCVQVAVIASAWRGRSGLQSIFRVKPFRAEYEMDNDTGEVKLSRRTTPTLISMFMDRWKVIANRRAQFEAAPDNGLLGKFMARPFHLFFQYVVRGLLGSLLYLLTVPPLSLIFVAACLVFGGALSPVLGAVILLLQWCRSMFLYDSLNGVRFPLIRLLLGMPLSLMGNLAVTSVLFVANLVVRFPLLVLYSLARYTLRRLWDAFVFAVIRLRVRIPAQNSFAAVRIHGPDMSSKYYFHISEEVALFLLRVELENIALDIQMDEEHRAINMVTSKWVEFLQTIARPFGSIDPHTSEKYKPIVEAANRRRDMLNKLSSGHRGLLQRVVTGIYSDADAVPHRFKQSTIELEKTIRQAALMLKLFYMDRLMPLWSSVNHDPAHFEKRKADFWSSKNLFENEFELLAVHYYERLFGEQFLVPLEQCDAEFVVPIRSEELIDLIFMTSSSLKGKSLHWCAPTAVAFEAFQPTTSSGRFTNPSKAVKEQLV